MGEYAEIARSVIRALNLRLSQSLELLAKARGAHAVERASRRSYLAGHMHIAMQEDLLVAKPRRGDGKGSGSDQVVRG